MSRGQGHALLSRGISHAVGDRGKEPLWNPKRCPRMPLSRHCKHASAATTTASEEQQRQQHQQKQIGRGEENKKNKKAREGVALSAAGTLHHRLLLWKGGRGAD